MRLTTATEVKIAEHKQVVPEKDENSRRKVGETGEKSKRSASELIAFFSHPKFSSFKSKNKDKDKDKEEKDVGISEKDRSSSIGKLDRRRSSGELNSKSSGKSWKRSLGIGSSSSKQDNERKLSNPSRPPSTTGVSLRNNDVKSTLSRIEEAKSSKRVPLREKKGRVTADERKAKAQSLGDINKQLNKVEVSILDPSAPPSRTVSTIDIPDKVDERENSALLGRRPVSAAAAIEPSSLNTATQFKTVTLNLERSPKPDASSTLNSLEEKPTFTLSSLEDKAQSPDALVAASGAKTQVPSAENSSDPLERDTSTTGERSESPVKSPDSPIWRRRYPLGGVSSPTGSSSSSGASVSSPKPRSSELPEQSTVPLHSPPQPVRLISSAARASPAGSSLAKEEGIELCVVILLFTCECFSAFILWQRRCGI